MNDPGAWLLKFRSVGRRHCVCRDIGEIIKKKKHTHKRKPSIDPVRQSLRSGLSPHLWSKCRCLLHRIADLLSSHTHVTRQFFHDRRPMTGNRASVSLQRTHSTNHAASNSTDLFPTPPAPPRRRDESKHPHRGTV